MPEIIIVTGKINSGKTTYFEKLINKEKGSGNFPTGIIARGVFNEKIKLGYDIVDIASGISMPLARTSPFADENIESGRFTFSEKAFKFAAEALLSFKPGGVVFLDEAGPIELNEQGHASSLRTLLESDIARLYIIVREELLDQFKTAFLGGRNMKIMKVDSHLSET